VCVDLTQQTAWVVRDGAIVLGPTVTRTGMRGFATPAGTFKIDGRNIREWSDPYKVWMPYWQHFTKGDGFHETTTYIHDKGIGSHGCVNLLRGDAKTLWNIVGVGTAVKLFGRRPGT
jgi:lipoprotein-anchoring transpeptidase ErfK/SrfK